MTSHLTKQKSLLFDVALPYVIVWIFLMFVAAIVFSLITPDQQTVYRYPSASYETFQYLPDNTAETSVTIREPINSTDAVRAEVIIK